MSRSILDLWVTGKEVTLDDGQGESVTVWLQKLVPAEQERAGKRANAARSTYMAFLSKPDESIEYQALSAEVMSLGDDRDLLLDLVLSEEFARKELAIADEIAEEERWSKDNYLEGLKESWEDGLKAVWAAGPEHEEYEQAEHVLAEIMRYNDEVTELVNEHERETKRDYEGKSIEWLQKEALKSKIKETANLEWMKVFRKAEISTAVRDVDDHNKQLLKFEDVDRFSAEALRKLMTEYRSMTADPLEGKD